MTEIGHHINFFRACAVAPLHKLRSYGTSVETLARIPVGEAGEVAVMLATAGKALVRQCWRATPDGQTALRDAIARTADALACELEARGGEPLPYYAGAER